MAPQSSAVFPRTPVLAGSLTGVAFRGVATFDDVARLALALPGTEERVSREHRQWRVGERLFVWERPLRKTDLAALGDAAPSGPILGARVEHEGAKQALVQDASGLYFTTREYRGA